MRLSGLLLPAVLLLSSIAVAQHQSSSAPSAPPPSPPPSAAPAPAPTPAPPPPPPSPPPSAPAPSVHISAPSAPTPVSVPESHMAPSPAPAPSPSPSHILVSTPTEVNGSSTAPVVHSPESDARHSIPDQKITGENRIVSAPRIGENPPEKPKPPESDLRHRICPGGSCKEPEPKPVPPESDLRKRICTDGPCTCPPGETKTKGGCVSNAPVQQCQGGEVWNGTACVFSGCPAGQAWNGSSCMQQCSAGQYWNGAACSPTSAECASIEGRASLLIAELRTLAAQVHQACSDDPMGNECSSRKQSQEEALQRYRMIFDGAMPSCRAALPDPASLI